MSYAKKRKQFVNKLKDFDLGQAKVVKQASIMTELPKKAVVYCRVSGDRQLTDGFGIEGQEETNIQWCMKEGIEVVKVFMDKAVSGALIDRPGINAAMEYLEQENKKYTKVGYFVCTENSRIARPEDPQEALMIEQRIEATGVKIVTTLEHRDTSTDEGKLMNHIKYAFASYERKKIAKRGKNGRHARMLQGYWTFKVPAGYKREGGGKNGIIVRDEPNASILKEALELYANNILVTNSDLVAYLNQQKFKTSEGDYKGKIWQSFPEKLFFLHRLYFYAGYILYPEWDINEPIDGKHVGLVSLDIVHKIIEKLQKGGILQRKPREKHDAAEFPLNGVLTCTGCGRKISYAYSTSGTGKKYPYYGCSHSGCKARESRPKEKLEQEFREYMAVHTFPKEVIDLFDAMMRETWEEDKQSEKAKDVKRKKQIEELEQQLSTVENTMQKTENKALFAKLDTQRSEINAEIELLKDELNNDIYEEKEFQDIYEKTKGIIEHPLSFRELGNTEIKQLLIAVRFGGILHYKKGKGFRTPQTGVLKTIYDTLNISNTGDWACRESNPEPWA